MTSEKTLSQTRGRGNLRHNYRDYPDGYMPPNIALDRVSHNVSAVKTPKTVEEAYDAIFGAAAIAFNQTQNRRDRKIDDYFEHEFGMSPAGDKAKWSPVINPKTGKNSFYEDIVQIGNMDDSGIIYEREPDTRTGRKGVKHDKNAKAIIKSVSPDYDKVVESLSIYMFGSKALGILSYQERNPNFIVFGGNLHLDEATPHWHIDYIPIGTKYKRGMSVQLSYTKALSEMGFYGQRAFANWREKERQVLRDIGEKLGLEMRSADKEIKGQEHLSVLEYQGIRAQIEQAESEYAELQAQIEQQAQVEAEREEARDDLDSQEAAFEEEKKAFEYQETLVAARSERNEDTKKFLDEWQGKLDECEEKLNKRKADLQAQEEENNNLRKNIAERIKNADAQIKDAMESQNEYAKALAHAEKLIEEIKDVKERERRSDQFQKMQNRFKGSGRSLNLDRFMSSTPSNDRQFGE